MPVLKVKKNGVWQDTFGISSHTHTVDDIVDFPNNFPSSGDADTLDGKHAEEFVLLSEFNSLQTKVGDTSVSEQIANAVPTKISALENDKGYITANEIPSSLPSVSSEDNGAILQVINGEWSISTIINAEGVAF